MRALLLLVLAGLVAGCTLPATPAQRPYYEEVVGGAPWTSLVVEVDHAPGRAPSKAALTHLEMTLRNITSKNDVRVEVRSELSDTPQRRWSAEDLVALERETRTFTHAEPQAVLHVLYPSGTFHREGVAGVTVSGPVIGPVVVFLDTLREFDSPLGPLMNPEFSVQVLERTTLLHEAGHAMGLVDNGLPQVRDREDKDHEGHSSNPESIMYWSVETLSGLRQFLLEDGSVPDEFDADDRADLRSAGGR